MPYYFLCLFTDIYDIFRQLLNLLPKAYVNFLTTVQ